MSEFFFEDLQSYVGWRALTCFHRFLGAKNVFFVEFIYKNPKKLVELKLGLSTVRFNLQLWNTDQSLPNLSP